MFFVMVLCVYGKRVGLYWVVIWMDMEVQFIFHIDQLLSICKLWMESSQKM